MSHLSAVPDPEPPDEPAVGVITDTSITFLGYLANLGIEKKSMQLQPTFMVDGRAPITDRDLRVLRGRRIRITIEPIAQDAAGNIVPASAKNDPVAEAVFGRRFERMKAGWLTDDDDYL